VWKRKLILTERLALQEDWFMSVQQTYYRKHTEHRQEPTKENIKKNQVIKPKDATYTI
jgi:hypothetical protein